MRWTVKYPEHGDVRYIKRFLFLPLTIGNETRWLERVEIRQVFYENYKLRKLPPYKSGWKNLCFKL